MKTSSRDISQICCSVIVLTKNEGRNIRSCLTSLNSFDQIFVLDSNSSDDTREISTKLGATVVDFTWNGKYPKKKQWALENLGFAYDWVLYVDADEQVTPELALEIQRAINESSHSGYLVGYDYVFDGSVLTRGAQAQKLILFNRHKGHFSDHDDLEANNMWEVEGHYQPVIDGTVGRLENKMLHNDHESLFHYFDRHNRYTDWEAVMRSKPRSAEVAESHSSSRTRLKRIFARLPGKPLVAFAYSYVFKLGFLDGQAGFNFALSRAFYYWQVGLKQRELRRRQRDG